MSHLRRRTEVNATCQSFTYVLVDADNETVTKHTLYKAASHSHVDEGEVWLTTSTKWKPAFNAHTKS